MTVNILVKDLYSEQTIDEALGRLRQLGERAENLEDVLHAIGIDKKTLTRTVQKGMEEYVDGLVELRHGWKPKTMDGNPEEKKEIYDGLAATIRRMDEFSEPCISAMRLVSEVALKQLTGNAPSEIRGNIEEALTYTGARYDFDEQNITVTSRDGRIRVPTKRRPSSVGEAYSQITAGFMNLKDLLNLMEDTTNPEVYQNIRNTNEFPEAKIGKCFECAHGIDATMKQLVEGYEFLSKRGGLPRQDKKELDESLKFLKNLDGNRFTRATQWYAALQFHEKPWNKIYNASITSLVVSVAGATYSLNPVLENIQTTGVANTFTNYTNEVGLFFASALWTIISGIAVYASTDAGPKTAKLLRILDEKVIRYRRV